MKISAQKQKFLFLCLALLLSLIPFRTLAPSQAEMLSSAAQCAEVGNAELPPCCRAALNAVEKSSCCCGHAPVKPVSDGRIVGSQSQLVKFISVKGSGRLLPQLFNLSADTQFTPPLTCLNLIAVEANPRPLYIIHRALLI